MQGEPDPNPAIWQHDVLYPDGTPYIPEEMALVKKLDESASRYLPIHEGKEGCHNRP